MKYDILIEWSEEDGDWFASVPALGLVSASGSTPEDALAALTDALDGLEASVAKRFGELPLPTRKVSTSV